MAPGVQLPQSAPNQQLGQGIVPPNMQPAKPFEPNQQAEEISTFFRNRQTVVQGTVAMNPVLKFFLFTSVVMGSFILAWNYVGQFRKRSQSVSHFKLNPNQTVTLMQRISDADGLHFGEEIQTVLPSLATDSAMLHTAECGMKISDKPTINPN